MQSRQPYSFPLKLRCVSQSSTQRLRGFGTSDPFFVLFFVSLCHASLSGRIKNKTRATWERGRWRQWRQWHPPRVFGISCYWTTFHHYLGAWNRLILCLNYSKCISEALAGLGVITGVIDNVDAATQEAPELPKCEHCGHAEAEQPGCILIFKRWGVESNDWRDASAKHKCFKVCEDCCSCRVSSATKRLPAERNTRIPPRWESTAVCRRICTVHRKPARSLVSRYRSPVDLRVLFLWLDGFLVEPLSQVGWDFLFLFSPSKRIQFPERRNFVCLVQSGIQEVLLANNRNRES